MPSLKQPNVLNNIQLCSSLLGYALAWSPVNCTAQKEKKKRVTLSFTPQRSGVKLVFTTCHIIVLPAGNSVWECAVDKYVGKSLLEHQMFIWGSSEALSIVAVVCWLPLSMSLNVISSFQTSPHPQLQEGVLTCATTWYQLFIFTPPLNFCIYFLLLLNSSRVALNHFCGFWTGVCKLFIDCKCLV